MFSWTEMEWEVSGAVTSGAVDTLDTVITNICARSKLEFITCDFFIYHFNTSAHNSIPTIPMKDD